MMNEYLKSLARDFNDRKPDEPESDFVRRVRDDILKIIDTVELSPYLEDDGSFMKPWRFVEGTAESVKVADVIKSIHLADPVDLYNVVVANRRLEDDDRLFSQPNNIEQDAYKLSIYLRSPDAYLNSVDMLVQKQLNKCDI